MARFPRHAGKGRPAMCSPRWPTGPVLHEADRMYLQVKRDNIPALRLYERMSFSEMFGYHRRVSLRSCLPCRWRRTRAPDRPASLLERRDAGTAENRRSPAEMPRDEESG